MPTERNQLLEKIHLAEKLGFQDDVRHWKTELKKLDEAEEERWVSGA